jgi:hypothetical protein
VRVGGWRHGAAVAVFACCILVGAWLLDLFARREFTVHLRNQAAYALELAAAAETPYRWRFRSRDDLLAGHPFDADDYAFADGALRVEAGSRPFEVGLPLARPLALLNFPLFHIELEAERSGELRLAVREKLRGPELLSAPLAFAPGAAAVDLDLQALAWTRGGSSDAVPAPRKAATLRLRLALSAPGRIVLRSAALQRAAGYVPLDLGRTPPIVAADAASDAAGPFVFRLPFEPEREQAGIARIVARRDGTAAPALILLPQHGRVEQQIALRNAVFAALPNAILIPEAQYEETFERARAKLSAGNGPMPLSTQWNLVAAFALILVIARMRSPRNPRLRALLVIVLTLAVPTWLIVCGNYDGTLHTPQSVMIGLCLIYAISLSQPRVWHWNGTARTWCYAGLVATLALAIGLALHGDPGRLTAAPGLRQIARYIVWALLQQYLVCAVCTERWKVITGSVLASTYLGALGFALLHTPNAALMLATFVGGLCWCAIYLRERALLPLAVSHAASALLLSALLPQDILHSAEVSVRFFQ